MKIAVISDIHANPVALENVLKDIESRRCDRIVCLGDIVGYGYDPNTCIRICRERGIECLQGNHDAGLVGSLSIDWFSATAKDGVKRHKKLVSAEDCEWLKSLPLNKREEIKKTSIAFAHGTYTMPEDFEYIDGLGSAIYELDEMRNRKIKILFVGHTHLATGYALKQIGDEIRPEIFSTVKECESAGIPSETTIKCKRTDTYIFNVGSVGYPRNQKASVYCIFDTTKYEVTYSALPFDLPEYIKFLENNNIDLPLWIKRFL